MFVQKLNALMHGMMKWFTQIDIKEAIHFLPPCYSYSSGAYAIHPPVTCPIESHELKETSALVPATLIVSPAVCVITLQVKSWLH